MEQSSNLKFLLEPQAKSFLASKTEHGAKLKYKFLLEPQELLKT